MHRGGLFGRPCDADFNTRAFRLICRSREEDCLVTIAFSVYGAVGETGNGRGVRELDTCDSTCNVDRSCANLAPTIFVNRFDPLQLFE